MTKKLCPEGLKLFQKYRESGKQHDYDAYLAHIRTCTNCFRTERKIADGITS